MTVYFIYARIPTKIYQKLPQQIVNFKYDVKNDLFYGIWGFTKERELAKRFMNFHKSTFFRIVKKRFENDMELQDEMNRAKIIPDDIRLTEHYFVCEKDGQSGSVSLVINHIEKDAVMNENYESESICLCDGPIRSNWFSKDIQLSLELLGFTTYEQLSKIDDDPEYMIADDGMGYGLTYPNGYNVQFLANELNYYIRKYHDILSC